MGSKKKASPLPVYALLCLGSVRLSSTIAINGYYSFAPYLVRRSLGEEASVQAVALWVGIIGSSFGLCQLGGGIVLGWASDRIGRIPVVSFACLAGFVCLLLFSLTTDVYALTLIRGVHGLLGGIVALTQAYLTEITDDTNSAKATSILSTCWGVGSVVGPAIGGLLAFPSVAAGSFLDKLPHFLPVLLFALLSLVACIAVSTLPETQAGAPWWGQPRLVCAWLTAKIRKRPVPTSPIHPSPLVSYKTFDTDITDENLAETSPTTTPTKPTPHHHNMFRDLQHLFQQGPVVYMPIIAFGIYIFNSLAQLELVPLWVASPQFNGGLGFSITETSVLLIASGAIMIPMNFYVVPKLVNHMGAKRAFISSLLVYSLYPILMPFTRDIQCLYGCSTVGNQPIVAWVWVAQIILCFLRGVTGPMVFTCSFLMVNNSTKLHLGLLNGIMGSCMALARGLAPLPAAAFLGWTLQNGLPFPFDYHFAWFVFGIGCIVGAVIGCGIPKEVNERPNPTEEP